MAIGLHGTMVIPPNAGGTTKLLGGEVSFTRVRTWYSKKGKLRFNSSSSSKAEATMTTTTTTMTMTTTTTTTTKE
jgi:hypothetical protein